MIACIGKNRELGHAGELVFHLREDMKFFKETTTGHPILMGRKTFESIGRPLPNRTNYVITRHPEQLPDGAEPVHSLKDFLESWKDTEEELFVIGGGMVYFESLPYAKNLYLTEVDATAADADSFFPDFDKSTYSKEILQKGKENDLAYQIVKYIKN